MKKLRSNFLRWCNRMSCVKKYISCTGYNIAGVHWWNYVIIIFIPSENYFLKKECYLAEIQQRPKPKHWRKKPKQNKKPNFNNYENPLVSGMKSEMDVWSSSKSYRVFYRVKESPFLKSHIRNINKQLEL